MNYRHPAALNYLYKQPFVTYLYHHLVKTELFTRAYVTVVRSFIAIQKGEHKSQCCRQADKVD